MPAIELRCTGCGAFFNPASGLYNCTECFGILELEYSIRTGVDNQSAPKDGGDGNGVNLRSLFSSPPTSSSSPPSSSSSSLSRKWGVWKYFDVLPVEKKNSIVSLEEGNTPLIKAQSLGNGVYVKDETRNPTGSFKDRPNTVGISKALELGAKTLAVASSGNAAGSLSAYAAKAGVDCVVCVPEDTPSSKLKQIVVFGAKVVRVKGTYSDSFNLIRESCRRFGWHNLTSVCAANPYQVEGDKTVSYEIYEQLNHDVPDWVSIPLGAGPLLVGIWRGFKELYDAGLSSKIPKLIGVQAEGCSPIVRAFKKGEKEVSPWEGKPSTIAHSIADPLLGYSQDGTLTLSKIRESNGVAESVSDREMLAFVDLLARSEGVFAEPAAAASIAVVAKLRRSGVLGRGKDEGGKEKVVSIVTGTGLKSLETLDSFGAFPQIVEPDPDALLELVDKGSRL